eukprot:1630512-Ditylum_brightwellii.AAC.1
MGEAALAEDVAAAAAPSLDALPPTLWRTRAAFSLRAARSAARSDGETVLQGVCGDDVCGGVSDATNGQSHYNSERMTGSKPHKRCVLTN